MSGTASCRWVRPILTMFSNCLALAAMASRTCSTAGIRTRSTRSAAAMCMAVGNVSFDDCDMLTSSLGWIGFFDPSTPPAISMARFEITSLTFMLVCVPLPVCQIRKGNWSLSFPAMTSSAACTINLALSARELAEFLIHECRGFFQDGKGANQFGRHGVAPDVEVMQRSLRLSAPVHVRGNFNLSHAVGFNAGGLLGRGDHRKTPNSAVYADAEFRKRTENYSNASARGVFCDTRRCDQAHLAKLPASYAVRCFRGSD